MPRKKTTWKRKRGRPALKRLAPGNMYRFGAGQMGRGTPYYINREVPVAVPVKDDKEKQTFYKAVMDKLDGMEQFSKKSEGVFTQGGRTIRAGVSLARDAAIGAGAAALAASTINPIWTAQFAANKTADWVYGAGEGVMKSKPGQKATEVVNTLKNVTTKDVMKGALYKTANVTLSAADMLKGAVQGTMEYKDEMVDVYNKQQQEKIDARIQAERQRKLELEQAEYEDIAKGYMEHQRQYDWVGEANREAIERSGDPDIKVTASSYMVQSDPSKQPPFIAVSRKSNKKMAKDPATGQWTVEPYFTWSKMPGGLIRNAHHLNQMKEHRATHFIGGSEL